VPFFFCSEKIEIKAPKRAQMVYDLPPQWLATVGPAWDPRWTRVDAPSDTRRSTRPARRPTPLPTGWNCPAFFNPHPEICNPKSQNLRPFPDFCVGNSKTFGHFKGFNRESQKAPPFPSFYSRNFHRTENPAAISSKGLRRVATFPILPPERATGRAPEDD
jgi:hypothetical protein